ncbi:unnamed protein product [Urochloa humidicola]
MERLVSPPPPLSPGAAILTTSPTPASTPEPAATHPTAPAKPSTQAPATHTIVRSTPPAGRSKVQRWSDSSPASASSGGSAAAVSGRPSYRDVVATSVNSAAPSRPPSPAVAKPPPRIILRPSARIPPPPRRTKDAEGWEQVESRYKRKERAAGLRRPRRPVPVDLRGRCFNCFSGEHRAAQCKSQTRCFRCRTLGHRSLVCPRRAAPAPEGDRGSVVLPKRVKVWRRITPAMEPMPTDSPQATATPAESPALGVASDVPRADESGALPPDSERGGRRRRRPRYRRCRAPQGEVDAVADTVSGNGRDTSPAPPARDDGVSPARGPPCVIDWSTHLARAEADLRRAVFVTVVGDISGLTTMDLKEVVASAFVLNPDSLEFRRSSQDHTYIMFVEDDATIVRITNAGPTPGSGGLQLHCRRWSRQAFAEGAPLPLLVDVELRGIPAHAWEMSTAESMLSPYGWPHLLQPGTRNRDDYSVFRVSAWCFNPREIPRVRDLHIVEPSIGEIMVPPGKPTLKYPVSIQVIEIQQSERLRGNQMPSDSDEDPTGNGRRQRRRASSPCVHGGGVAAAVTGRPAAGARLGPDASGARHVACSVEADGSSSLAASIEPPPIDGAAVTTSEPEMAAVVSSPEAEGLASGLEAAVVTGPEAEERAPGFVAAAVIGLEAEELALGLEGIKVHAGPSDSLPGTKLDPGNGVLGHQVGMELGHPSEMGCTVDRADPHSLSMNECEQEIQEHDPDILPSMESPTMASFAVSNYEQHLEIPCESITEPEDKAPDVTTVPTQLRCSTGSSPPSYVQKDSDIAPDDKYNEAIIAVPEQLWCSTGSPSPSCAQKDSENLLRASPVGPPSSPVTWRPAEDVLPTEPMTGSILMHAGKEISKVYARRPRINVHQEIQQVPGSPPCTPPAPAASSNFIKNVTKPLDTTLPIPTVRQQRRRHDYVGTEPPRRSRRIANLPPENHNPSATSVCRELGFTDENSKVSAAMVEKNQVFFNTPLKRNDVKIMAAMLRKELPDEFPVRNSDVVIVA